VLEPPSSRLADPEAGRGLEQQRHRAIQAVSEDLEEFRFNTMIAHLMEYTNLLARARESGSLAPSAWNQAIETLLLLMAPAAPHITEELWARLGKPYSIHNQAWPEWDEDLARSETFTLVVQVNGKLRDRLEAPVEIGEAEARELALASPRVQSQTEGRTIERVLFVPRRLVNIVVR
jgi:leucyl-tRNA synthetase